jgi:hypothetical protein
LEHGAGPSYLKHRCLEQNQEYQESVHEKGTVKKNELVQHRKTWKIKGEIFPKMYGKL